MNVDEQTAGALAHRVLDDGRVLAVYPMLFTFRLTIGPVEVGWFDDGWCYHDAGHALLALAAWDGQGDDPPFGWHRHLRSGRRRPDGDPTKEYVAP